jgi:diguanylate cyclase (GGDEF)-like protein
LHFSASDFENLGNPEEEMLASAETEASIVTPSADWTALPPFAELLTGANEPEPVRTAADLLDLGFWSFSRSSEEFAFSARALNLLGVEAEGGLETALSPSEYYALLENLKGEQETQVVARVRHGRILIHGWQEFEGAARMVGTITPLPSTRELQGGGIETHPLLMEAMEHGTDSMLVLRAIRNESGQTVDFEVVEANARGAELLGCSRSEAKGKLIRQWMPSLEEDGTIQRYVEAMQLGAEIENDFFMAPGGVQRIWIQQRLVPLSDGVAVFARDVSSSRIADEVADRSRRMFERIAITTPDGLALWDVDTKRFLYVNRQFGEMIGLAGSNADRMSVSDIERGIAAHQLAAFRDYLTGLSGLATDATKQAIFHVPVAAVSRDSGGFTRHLLFRSTVFERKAAGQPRSVLTSIQDVTEQSSYRTELEHKMRELDLARAQLELRQRDLESLNEQLSQMALMDATTGIKNRRAFEEKLEEETERAQRYNSRLALVLADLDRFKVYNDTHGHPAGDGALKGFAEVLVEVCRKSDTVARFGGEEFAILLPNTGATEAGLLGERIRVALAATELGKRGLTTSIGCAEFIPGKQGKERMVNEADEALYASKNSGRDKVTVFGQP